MGDPSALLAPGAALERLGGGAAWSEGPLWLPDRRRVRWSDIPNDRILEWDQASGAVTVFRDRAEYPNGRARDHDGRVVQCSHGRRAVEREGTDGPEVVVERWHGGRFNSPNDVAVADDGTIWFTDPPYGLHPSGREGRPGPQDYAGCFVFRFEPTTGEAEPVVTDLMHPNGIAFSVEGTTMYVSDTGDPGRRGTPHIWAYTVGRDRVSRPGRYFARVPVGMADGFTVDRADRLWSSAGDGVYVFAPDGALLLHIPAPEKVSNVCFGGDEGDELFITATTSLYRIRTTTAAARG